MVIYSVMSIEGPGGIVHDIPVSAAMQNIIFLLTQYFALFVVLALLKTWADWNVRSAGDSRNPLLSIV